MIPIQPTPPPTNRRAGVRWLAIVCAIVCAIVTFARMDDASAQPRGPDDMPDVGVGALEDHPIPRTPSDYIHHEVGWALFAYPREARAAVEPLVESAHEVRTNLRDELGQDVLLHVEVRIASDAGQMAKLAPGGLPPPEHAIGAAYARHRLILLTLPSAEGSARDLEAVYRHELAHVALFDAAGGNDLPAWFHEGYAIRFSEENVWSRKRLLWGATVMDGLMPLSELERFPLRGGEQSLASAQAADFVRFLLRRQDQDRFRNLVARLERGELLSPALQGAYGAPIRSLEREWHDDLDERYSFLPLFVALGLIGVVLAGAFVVRARRRRDRQLREEREEKRAALRSKAKDPPVRVTLTSRSVVETVDLAALRRAKRGDVPKVVHDGKWHTLH